jgi:DNA/RNA endonuclease YhcR with UshA esterase domain
MLSDKALIILSLSLTLLGTLALYLILLTSELPVSDLTVVDKAHEAETVRVTGTVEAVRHGKNSTVTILTLSEQVQRTAVAFDTLNFTPGQKVEIEGQVQMYEGEPELLVRKATTLNPTAGKAGTQVAQRWNSSS